MSKSPVLIKVGLTKEEVISRIGKPDRREYIKISFRPPKHGEQKNDYQKALREWEKHTVGELWHYDEFELTVKISKAEQVVSWSEGQITKTMSTESGLITIEPKVNRNREGKE